MRSCCVKAGIIFRAACVEPAGALDSAVTETCAALAGCSGDVEITSDADAEAWAAKGCDTIGGNVVIRTRRGAVQSPLVSSGESLVIGCQAPKPRVAVLVAVTVLSFGFSIRQERPNSLVLATAADSPTKPASVGKTLANKQA